MLRTMAIVATLLSAALGIGRPARGGEPAEAPAEHEPAASITSPEQFVDRIRELIDAQISAAAVRLVTLTPEQRARVSALLERAIADINRRRLIAAGQPDLAAQLPPDAPGDVIAKFADRINADPNNAASAVIAASKALAEVHRRYHRELYGQDREASTSEPYFLPDAWAGYAPDAELLALIREYVARAEQQQVWAHLDRAAAAPYLARLLDRFDGEWDVTAHPFVAPRGWANLLDLRRAVRCGMLLSVTDGDFASLPRWRARLETLARFAGASRSQFGLIMTAAHRGAYASTVATAYQLRPIPREITASLLQAPAAPPMMAALDLATDEALVVRAMLIDSCLSASRSTLLARNYLNLPLDLNDPDSAMFGWGLSLFSQLRPEAAAPARPDWAPQVDAIYRDLPDWPELAPIRRSLAAADWWKDTQSNVALLHRHHTHAHALCLFLALELYRADHADTYPTDLADLVPKYLPAIPVNLLSPGFAADPLSGWHYRRHEAPDDAGRRVTLGPNRPPSEGRAAEGYWQFGEPLGPPGPPSLRPFGLP